MAEKLSDTQIAEIKEAFDLFDKEHKEFIGFKQLGTVISSLGYNPTEAELQNMIDKAISEQKENIDFPHLLSLIASRLENYDAEAEIIESLKVFDKHGNGLISAAEFRYFINELGEKVSDEEIDELLKELTIDENGYIKIEEIGKVMMSK